VIYAYCPACRSNSTTNAKKCRKCGEPFHNKARKYRVRVKVSGKRVDRICDNLAIAREVEAALKGDLVRGEYDILKKRVPTLDELWARYLPFAKERKKSWRADEKYYRAHIRPRIGKKRLDKISPLDLERLRSEMQKQTSRLGRPYAPATIKHQLVIIRRLYNLAAKWGIYDGPNPVKRVTMPKLDNEVVRFLTEEETARLLEVLSWWPFRHSAVFVKFALLTGFRRGEIMRLRWYDVDEERALVTLRDPKGGKSETVPVAREAIEALQELPRNTEWIFPGKNGKPRTDFKGPWLRIKKQAGLPENFRFHDLRHNFASTLVSRGVPLEVVSRLLTHKSLAVTQRYAHLQPGALRNAADAAGKVISNPRPRQEGKAHG